MIKPYYEEDNIFETEIDKLMDIEHYSVIDEL